MLNDNNLQALLINWAGFNFPNNKFNLNNEEYQLIFNLNGEKIEYFDSRDQSKPVEFIFDAAEIKAYIYAARESAVKDDLQLSASLLHIAKNQVVRLDEFFKTYANNLQLEAEENLNYHLNAFKNLLATKAIFDQIDYDITNLAKDQIISEPVLDVLLYEPGRYQLDRSRVIVKDQRGSIEKIIELPETRRSNCCAPLNFAWRCIQRNQQQSAPNQKFIPEAWDEKYFKESNIDVFRHGLSLSATTYNRAHINHSIRMSEGLQSWSFDLRETKALIFAAKHLFEQNEQKEHNNAFNLLSAAVSNLENLKVILSTIQKGSSIFQLLPLPSFVTQEIIDIKEELSPKTDFSLTNTATTNAAVTQEDKTDPLKMRIFEVLKYNSVIYTFDADNKSVNLQIFNQDGKSFRPYKPVYKLETLFEVAKLRPRVAMSI